MYMVTYNYIQTIISSKKTDGTIHLDQYAMMYKIFVVVFVFSSVCFVGISHQINNTCSHCNVALQGRKYSYIVFCW